MKIQKAESTGKHQPNPQRRRYRRPCRYYFQARHRHCPMIQMRFAGKHPRRRSHHRYLRLDR